MKFFQKITAVLVGATVFFNVAVVAAAASPHLSYVSPVEGIPGRDLSVKGVSFPENSTGAVYFDSNNNTILDDGENFVNVSATGSFNVSLLVPAATLPGVYYVGYRSDQGIVVAPLTYTVLAIDPRLELSPSRTGTVSGITVKGKGFPGNLEGEVFIDINADQHKTEGEPLKSVKTSNSGTFTDIFDINLAPGIYSVIFTSTEYTVNASVEVFAPYLKGDPDNGAPGTVVSIGGYYLPVGEQGVVYFDSNNNNSADLGEPQVPVAALDSRFMVDIPVPSVVNGTYFFRYKSSGNTIVTPKKFRVLNVDSLAPVTTASFDQIPQNGWFHSDVSITLTAQDDISGVEHTEYKISGDAVWIKYEEPINYTAQDEYMLQYRSIDRAGNVEQTKNLSVRIDTIAPSFRLTLNGSPFADGSVLLDYLTPTFNVETSDAQSGVSSLALEFDGQAYNNGSTVDLAGKLGVHTLRIIALDKAGNTTDQTITFKVETSIESVKYLVDRYIASGDIKGSLVPLLKNLLNQSQAKLSSGLPKQAAKFLADIFKHIDSNPKQLIISEKANAVLQSDLQALLTVWSG
jgi:hypothetical protein